MGEVAAKGRTHQQPLPFEARGRTIVTQSVGNWSRLWREALHTTGNWTPSGRDCTNTDLTLRLQVSRRCAHSVCDCTFAHSWETLPPLGAFRGHWTSSPRTRLQLELDTNGTVFSTSTPSWNLEFKRQLVEARKEERAAQLRKLLGNKTCSLLGISS